MIVGRAEEVVDPTEIAETVQMELRPWTPGSRSRVISIKGIPFRADASSEIAIRPGLTRSETLRPRVPDTNRQMATATNA